MATEIANAYIAITTRMPSIKSDLTKSLGGSDVQGVLDQQGKSMGSKLMSSLGTAAKRTAIGVGIAAGAAVGAALVSGFRSAMQQQDIQATVAGLYGDAEKAAGTLQKIKDIAGTSPIDYSAYGKAAQSLAYAGVEGDRAVNVLENVGAALVGAGGGSAELERAMAGVLKGVNNGGIVMNDTLNIISESGFPIISALQEKFGTTGDVIKDMAAKGKISIDDVLSVMENGTGALTKAQMSAADEVSKTFGNQWTIAKDNISVAIGGVMIPLLEKVAPIIKPVSDAIVGFVNKIPDIAKFADTASYFSPLGLVFKALQPVLPTIGKALADIGKVFLDMAQQIMPVLLPVFQTLVTLLTDVFKAVVPIVQMLVSALVPVFQALAPIITTVLQAFAPLIQILVDLLTPILRLVANIISTILAPVLNVLVGIIKVVADIVVWLIQGAFNNLVNILRVLGDAFTWLWLNVIQPVWQGIQSAIDTAWKWIDKNVFTPFKTGIGYIGTAFENVAKAIGTAWDGIKKAAAVPINFVLETVWNNGLRSFWNDMVGTLGLNDMKLPKAKLVKFADGGVLPGYTPGRDVHEFYSPTGGRLALSGGEAIMRPEFTRAVGGAAGVARLNSMARNGQAFADGGVWGNIGSFAGDVWDNIAGAASVAWEFLSNPAGAIQKHVIDGIINPLLSNVGGGVIGKAIGSLPGMLMKNMTGLLEKAAPKGVGTAGMGWQAMWQIVQNAIPGVVKTSDYRPGSMTVNGTKSYHGSGRAIDLVPASMATFNQVARLFPNASELIYSPAGNRQLLNGKPFNGWSDAVRRQHYNHVHLAMANGGVVPKLYDQGGWLPSGGMAVNKSGKPEAVLTPAQSEALVNGGFPRELVIVDADRQLIGRMRVEADARIGSFDSAQERVSRGRVR